MGIIVYAGNAGDRNPRAMQGSLSLGAQLGAKLGLTIQTIGSVAPVLEGGWRQQLAHATPNLRLLAAKMSSQRTTGHPTLLVAGRCAASLATLPRIFEQFPDALLVWFDAHGDSNRPHPGEQTDSSYLGGMVLTGAAGEWDTGFGGGLNLANVILVGARDLDPPEQARIAAGEIRLIDAGPDLADRLRKALDGRRIYIHLDCDVLSAGLLATEYQVPNGLSFDDLHEAFEVLAEHELIGLEIAEYEDCWPDGRTNRADALITAIAPVTRALCGRFRQKQPCAS